MNIIVIVRKLGHCILYNSLCDMGAAQTYCSLILLKKGNIFHYSRHLLMMQLELFEGKDNFPTIVKYVGRGGLCSDYATQLVAFQQVAPSNTVKT